MTRILSLGAALLVTAIVPALAAPEPGEEVTIFGPYTVKTAPTGQPRINSYSVSRDVGVKDLDLATAEGRAVAEARVKQMARDVCTELDRRFPPKMYIPQTDARDCVKDAVTEAMAKIGAAEKTASR